MVKRLIFVCNALDEKTRIQRGISTDSPAASRKIFMMCSAIRLAKVRPIILSLGRGRQNNSGMYFPAFVKRVNGIQVVYAPFIHVPILSQLFSLIAPLWFIWHFRRLSGKKTILFYNRMPAYTLTLILAFFLRYRTVLDLEDGEITDKSQPINHLCSLFMRKLFDLMCSGGAMLACSALEKMTSLRPAISYYGCASSSEEVSVNWLAPIMGVLFGGTLSRVQGSMLLVEAIKLMRKRSESWCQNMIIEVTGKGDAVEDFLQLSREAGYPEVRFHGRMTNAEYRSIVSRCHVGLSLKPNAGILANTTFPSKVNEIATSGLLVLTTKISDVEIVLGNGALYLTENTPEVLVKHFRWIVLNRNAAAKLAYQGRLNVEKKFAPSVVGLFLANILFESDGYVD